MSLTYPSYVCFLYLCFIQSSFAHNGTNLHHDRALVKVGFFIPVSAPSADYAGHFRGSIELQPTRAYLFNKSRTILPIAIKFHVIMLRQIEFNRPPLSGSSLIDSMSFIRAMRKGGFISSRSRSTSVGTIPSSPRKQVTPQFPLNEMFEIVQGDPSAFVDIKTKVPSQYKLLISTLNLVSTKTINQPDGSPCNCT